MTLEGIKKSLDYLFKANITPFIWGTQGVGKSANIKQYTVNGGHGMLDFRLATQDPGDLIGLADFLIDDKTGQKVATKFMPPEWIKQVFEFCKNNPDKYFVIFLDELNRAKRDVLQIAFQLVYDKAIHDIKLPENCKVVAAGNPNTEGFMVTDIQEDAFMDRFCHITVTPSVSEWVEHATKANYNKTVVNFFKEQPTLLYPKNTTVPELKIESSLRAAEFVSRLANLNPPDELFTELCMGIIGKPATLAFEEYRKTMEVAFKSKDIFKNYPKIKKQVKKYTESNEGGRHDLLKATCDNLVEKLVKDEHALTDDEATNLFDFLGDLPIELLHAFYKDVYILSNSFRDYEEKNKNLRAKLAKVEKSVKEKTKDLKKETDNE